jgi:drug/metabolite transporter (DMT)-like permease
MLGNTLIFAAVVLIAAISIWALATGRNKKIMIELPDPNAPGGKRKRVLIVIGCFVLIAAVFLAMAMFSNRNSQDQGILIPLVIVLIGAGIGLVFTGTRR